MGAMSMTERRPRRGDVVVSEPHTRPDHCEDKRGSVGQPLKVATNYFELTMAPDFNLYQYHVSFAPEIVNKRMRSQMVKEHKDLLGETRAFDGMILFLPRKLPQNPTEVYSTRQSDGEKVRITFALTNELPPNSPTCLQMYNIIFRRILAMIDCQQIQRHYYAPSMAVTIPQHKLEVWPGYITSILQYESKVFLMSDISHKILRTNTVLDQMYDIYNRNQRGFHEECTKKLVGEIVLTRYNNKTYRIDDIDWDLNPTSTFKTTARKFQGGPGAEVDVSYMDYYLTQHKITVHDKNQPLLVSRPKKSDIRRGQEGNIYLLPELCTLTGLAEEVRSDFQVMKDIGAHTRVGPDGRMNTLKKFIDRINSQEDCQKELRGWGLKFAQGLFMLNARTLPPENILQAGTQYKYSPATADWERNMRGQKLISCVDLANWMVVFTQRDKTKANDFLQNMNKVCPPMGIRVARPNMLELPDDNNNTFLRAISNGVNNQTQMVVVVLPTNRKDRYDAVKKYLCIDHPVPSQCVVGRTLGKKNLMSIVTKIAIQINIKLGGQAWSLEIPLQNMMVCGVDTYHDSQVKGRSVAALVCSLNRACTRYYSKITFQHTHQELSDGLRINLTAALKKYHEVNGALPDRIILFRDGVGDGQLEAVYEHEIPQLLECFNQLGTSYNPRCGVIVVKKRINSRFFSKQGADIVNPPPGTIIDSEVTRPEWYDFYLISQSVRQGTVTPTHYNICHDTTGLKPDHFQRLTYKMCHLYYNWPGTIRVPAPCQYAHKLAFLVGQSLHKDPAPELADKLYFL
jgi:aubergine-like protein